MSHQHQNVQSSVQLFKKYVFSPFQNRTLTSNQDQLEHIAQEIYNWARNNGAQYVSFLAFPMRCQTLEKHVTFLSLKFIKENLLQSIGSEKLKFSHIWKDEVDASGLPNGGLRQNNQSRGFLIWDHLSQLFVKQGNKVLYVPSFIVTPDGHALDDRLNFRKTQKMFQKQMEKLLQRFGIEYQEVFLSVSLEQQFYILPKQFAEKRLDLKYTNRLLIGRTPFFTQPHYTSYQKMHEQIEKTLKQAEKQLLQLGVPIKVRHNEAGLNHFEVCSQVENVAAAIDHNILKMQIIKEACDRNGLMANFHEKPFVKAAGSGKHINWSISYLDKDEKHKNLYDLKTQHKQLLKILLLLTIKAAQDNHKLFVASTMTAGNDLRFGETEAPLPVMSVFLGEEASNLIEGLQLPQASDLKQKTGVLLKSEFPEIGDRNRTSTLAYSDNRFELRLPSSSQNCTFPCTVIMASLLNEIKIFLEKLDNGQTVSQIITQYREYTRNIRYQGDCHSEEWKQEAQKRGLYNPNKTIVERIKNIRNQSKVLTDNEIYSHKQIEAKYDIMKNDYMDTVNLQRECLLKMVNTNLIPRCYSFIATFPRELHLKNIENRMKKFDKLLQELIGKTDDLQNQEIDSEDFSSAYKIRQHVSKISDLADKILEMLPESESFPEINYYLNKWKVQ